MNPRTPSLFLFLAACASAKPIASAPAPSPEPDAWREVAPQPLPPGKPFAMPMPREGKLANGARLVVVENHALPLVSMRVDVLAGIDDEPVSKRGLTWFIREGLLEGTTSRSAAEIGMASDRLAAQLWTDNGDRQVTVGVEALKETLPDSVALLTEVLLHPAFRPADLERLRGRLLTRLTEKKSDARTVAWDDLNPLLWGTSRPRGMPSGGTPATVKSIQVDELRRFHRTWFVPNNALVTVAGDTTLEEMKALLDSDWRGWKAHRLPSRKAAALPPASPRRIVFTEAPRATQSEVTLGWHGPLFADPDSLPLTVANTILGGEFSSRLNQNIRETKGYSYGVWSYLSFHPDSGTISAGGAIQAAHTAEAVVEFEKELDRLVTTEFSEEEIARAKESLIRSVPRMFERNGTVAGAFAGLVFFDAPLDFYATYADRVRAITADDMRRAVKKWVTPERWPVVVVGPREQVLEPLRKLGLGPVEEIKAE